MKLCCDRTLFNGTGQLHITDRNNNYLFQVVNGRSECVLFHTSSGVYLRRGICVNISGKISSHCLQTG
jgi:hypothetical protein